MLQHISDVDTVCFLFPRARTWRTTTYCSVTHFSRPPVTRSEPHNVELRVHVVKRLHDVPTPEADMTQGDASREPLLRCGLLDDHVIHFDSILSE